MLLLSSNSKPTIQMTVQQLTLRAQQVAKQGPKAALDFWNSLSPEQKATVMSVLKTAATAAVFV